MKFAFLVARLALLAGGYTLSAEGQTGRPSFVQMQDTDPALAPSQAATQSRPETQSRACAHENPVGSASKAGTSRAAGSCTRSQSDELRTGGSRTVANASSVAEAAQ